uniref:Secreted frizzled-related protein 1 n=1 Tax=Rhabditophanes sp. KR3021 TaxID=114890 RepID=A0AC35U6L9_9BILA
MSYFLQICAVILITISPASLLFISAESWATFHADRLSSPKCVEIPSNFTLCKDMQYTSMRLPNFFDQEILPEVMEQSASWIPLANINCHPDTKMFLCSLFAPVCLSALDKHIPPCRSLCQAVRQGCEDRMIKYGFEWPEMLNCNKYPLDNDMCIKAIEPTKPSTVVIITSPRTNAVCKSCSQIVTYENIIDNFCRSQIVIKGKLNKVDRNLVSLIKGGLKNLKLGEKRRVGLKNRLIKLNDYDEPESCICPIEKGNHLVMAEENKNGEFIAKLVMPWKKDNQEFKKTIKAIKKLNCHSLGREIRQSVFKRPYPRTLSFH